jgi:hypothetical protein
MKELRYFLAWLLMPVLALRHKIKRVTHYEVQSETLKTQVFEDYITANFAFSTLLESGRYGDFIKLIEFRKNKEPKTISKLEW